MTEMDGLYIGNIRFYVTVNACVDLDGTCQCDEMRQQLQAQLMGWTE
jgi:hypothetical protein